MNYDVGRLVKKVKDHMGWTQEKTLLWFASENPNLGGTSPEKMIFLGRFEKLEKWIDCALDENKPIEQVKEKG